MLNNKEEFKAFEAVVFDMDGVIFDSEIEVINCWKVVAEKYGFTGIEQACIKCLGANEKRSREIMLESFGPDFPYDRYTKEKSDIFHERFDGGRLPIKKGVRELLEALKAAGIKIALASSTRQQTVEAELRDGGLLQYFDVIVGGDQIKRSKPEPDIFLKACELLGVTPEDSYAIEDSFNGIRAAAAGRLRPIMVPDILQPTDEIRELTVTVLEDLLEVKQFLGV